MKITRLTVDIAHEDDIDAEELLTIADDIYHSLDKILSSHILKSEPIYADGQILNDKDNEDVEDLREKLQNLNNRVDTLTSDVNCLKFGKTIGDNPWSGIGVRYSQGNGIGVLEKVNPSVGE